MPFPPMDGGAQVMHFTTKGLLINHIRVKTLAMNPTRNYIDITSLPADFIKSTNFESVTIDTKVKFLNLFFNMFRKESYFTERFNSTAFENKLQSFLNQKNLISFNLNMYTCVNTSKRFGIFRMQKLFYAHKILNMLFGSFT